MHTKRYVPLSLDLCKMAVIDCFRKKWGRRDVLSFIEKYSGIYRNDLLIEEISNTTELREEAIESVAIALYETMSQIIDGEDPDDIIPVIVSPRKDGMTGKIRDIAVLCIMHQLVEHAVKLMIDPLIYARLLNTQHASIPKRGQDSLKKQTRHYFSSDSLGITYIQKTDVVSAYNSLSYSVCLDFIRKEIPKYKPVHILMEYLGKLAPGGHLIIGGYLDAWLFNFVMSYAIRYVYTLGTKRRGKIIPYIIRCDSYMDDFCLMSSSIKGIKRSVKSLNNWMEQNTGLKLKITTGITKLLSHENEIKRLYEPHGKSGRGCPSLDMAGYKISRTHVTIRRRVFLRARRQFLRGYDELKKNGTLSLDRAKKIIAYNGYVSTTDSEYVNNKYHVYELMKMAVKVSSFYGFLSYKRRMEGLYAIQKRRIMQLSNSCNC